MDRREGLESRLGEQISLKQPHPCLRQPAVLLQGLDSLGNHVNPEFKADMADRTSNCLTRPVAFYAAYKAHVEFDLIRLEIGEQVEPGMPRAKVIDSCDQFPLKQKLHWPHGVMAPISSNDFLKAHHSWGLCDRQSRIVGGSFMSDVGEGEGALEPLPCANMSLHMITRSRIWGRFGDGSARNSALLGNGCSPITRYANRAKPHKHRRFRILLIWRVGT